MANIRLDEGETELVNEVGSRGDAFREAVRGRAEEEVRVSQRSSSTIDEDDNILAVAQPPSPTLTEPPLESPKPGV